MKSGLELDLSNVVIWMIDTSNKTLEDMLKTYSTCKSTRHKMEEAQKTREETELAGAAQQHWTYPVCSGRSTRLICVHRAAAAASHPTGHLTGQGSREVAARVGEGHKAPDLSGVH